MTAGRWIRCAGPLVALLALLAGGLLTPAAPARAAVAPLPLTLLIDTLTPLAPTEADTLLVSGMVTNTSALPVTAISVRLRVSEAPLADRAALATVSEAAAAETGTPVDGARSLPIPTLLPGQKSAFTVSVPMASLHLGTRGVYLLALEAQSDPGDENLQRVGLRRTLLPWIPNHQDSPVTGLVTLWPLAATPAVDAEGVLLDDHLARDVSAGGRLRTLLDAGAAHSTAVSWLADPAVLRILDTMGNGYRVREGEQIRVGDRSAQARGWLDTLRRTTSTAGAVALPSAVPDAVALVRGGLSREVVRSITSAAPELTAILGHSVTSTLAWPADGYVDDATLRVMVDASPRAVLISGAQFTSDADFTPSGFASVPGGAGTAVVSDARLSTLVATQRRTDPEPVVARQRVLAELAMIALELPATSRTVVVAPPLLWTPSAAFTTEYLNAITSVPWVRPTSLTDLLGSEPSIVPRTLRAYPLSAQRRELSPAYVSRVSATLATTAVVGEVVTGSGPLTLDLNAASARASATTFRGQTTLGNEVIDSAAHLADAQLAGVRIVSKGTVTLPGDTGSIPVSIANSLETPVTVALHVTAVPSVRLSASPVTPVTIPGGATVLVEVPARVSGSDPVAVTLRLTTPEGTVFGAPASLQVGSSAYSRAAAWAVGGAFTLLVVMLIFNAVRRWRQARAAAAAAARPNDTMEQ